MTVNTMSTEQAEDIFDLDMKEPADNLLSAAQPQMAQKQTNLTCTLSVVCCCCSS